MIGVTELRSGTIFEEGGNFYQVLSYEHIKMGRGSANIKVKVKNLKNGSITDKSFINGARVKPVQVLKRDIQYLYKDDSLAYFMNPQSFDQISINLSIIGNDIYFLKEGETYNVSFLSNEPLALNLPSKIDLTIAETGPSLRGNSATNIYKEAILENGLKTKVPLFLKEGEKIRIDTRTGEYTQKVN